MPMADSKEVAERRKRRLMKFGAAAGAVLALACHVMPPKLQAACHAVSQIAPLACGAGGH
jgi:hypothetical protein